MPFAAALATDRDTARAVDEVCSRVAGSFPGKPDLAFAFLSAHHAGNAPLVVRQIQERLAPRRLLGCTGEAIVGNDQEVEGDPALSLWVGGWDKKVDLTPFHLTAEQTPDGITILGWPDAFAAGDPKRSAVLLLADPYTFPIDTILERLNEDHPGLRVVGGMASGGRGRGRTGYFKTARSIGTAPSACCSTDRWRSAASSRKAAGPSAGTWS